MIRSEKVVKLPLTFGEKRVDVHVAVLPTGGSHTPLLLSKEFLKWLGAVIDTGNNTMYCKAFRQRIRLAETDRGQYAIPVLPVERNHIDEPAAAGSTAEKKSTTSSSHCVPECCHGQRIRGDHTQDDGEISPETERDIHVPKKDIDEVTDISDDEPWTPIPGSTRMECGKYGKARLQMDVVYRSDKQYIHKG